MKEAIHVKRKYIQPSFMVTHIAAGCTGHRTSTPADIPGGKKLIYNGVNMPLTAITGFRRKGKRIRCSGSWRVPVEETHGI